jgi:Ca2+-binding RTX toxin-like protein
MSVLPQAVDDTFATAQSVTGSTVISGNLGSNDISSTDSSMFGWAPAGFTGVGYDGGWYTWDTSNPADPYLVFIEIVQSGYVTFPRATRDSVIFTEQGGWVVLNTNGTFTYTALNGYIGPDSFDYAFVDEQFGVSEATVQLNVTYTPGANLKPIAKDDTYHVAAGLKYTSSVSVLTNDADGPDNITTDNLLSIQGTTFASANGGVVSLFANGQFTYTPRAGFVGIDSFNYTVRDGLGATDKGTVTLHVGTTINTAPVAGDDTFSASHGRNISGNVLTNDTDINGDTVQAMAGTYTTTLGGTVTLLANGTFTFVPASNAAGTDGFTYSVFDGRGGTDQGFVTLKMTNAAPVAITDVLSVAYGNKATGNLLTNDSDADGDMLAAGAGTFATAAGGSVTILANGGYTYTGKPGYAGSDSFQYSVSDGFGGLTKGLLNIKVLPPSNYQKGTAGADTMYGTTTADVVSSGAGDDVVYGNDGNDKIYGSSGRDNLQGQNGDDRLVGNTGKDTLIGGAGNDWLDGGDHGDTYTGGTGADRFYLRASNAIDYDRITDFTSGTDKLVLDLSRFGLADGSAVTLEAIGTAADGQHRLVYDKDNKSLYLDDGTSAADVLLTTFSSKVTLLESDIILM